MMNRIFLLSFFCSVSLVLFAQNPSKKTMTPAVYDSWNTIKDKQISANGDWVSYELTPGKGDPTLVIFDTNTQTESRYERSSNGQFSYNGNFAFFKISPPADTLQNQRRRKVKDDDLPNDTLAILNLRTKELSKIADLKSFQVPKKWNGSIAYQLEKPIDEPVDSATISIDTATQQISLQWNKKETNDNGTRLYIKDLTSNRIDTIFYVQDYVFAEESARLLCTSSGNDSTTQAGVYWFDCQKQTLQHLIRGEGTYKNLALDKTGAQASFVADLDTTDARIRPWELYYWNGEKDTARVILKNDARFLPDNWLVSEHFKPQFSKKGSQLFFGINPSPILQDTSLLDEEIVTVEVWSYLDKRLHTQQKVDLEKDKKKAFLCVYHPKKGTFQQIADSKVSLSNRAANDDSNIALVYEEAPYLETISWEGFPSYKDIYWTNTQTGKRNLVARKVKANPQISPNAKYVFWYSNPDSIWMAVRTDGSQPTPISLTINELVYNELNDLPMNPWAYGIAGWLEKDESILIYDRYDIWQVNPDGAGAAKRLTKGRETKTVYRAMQLDREATNFSKKSGLLLHVFNEESCASGYAKLDFKTGAVQSLLQSDHRYTLRPIKAQNADKIVFTKENFQEFPDLQLTDSSFRNPQKISTANPQQNDYSWGSIEHIEWTGLDGQNIRGMLVKPENFDPTKKYPLLVNFYERSSHRLHTHRSPFPHRSTINYSYYTNRGYIIFNPDVPYKIGYPGQSSENAVLSGVTYLVAQGFIDKDRIGVQGHSWGGYQIAHLVTKTNIFACAESGAPVVNMFSAYGGIRWRSGLSRMFQYEHTQSRIGGTIWEKPLRYLENSPIFFADKIETPVLIMHNDKDGAVPWYQGIEFFVAMRRLGKPAWLLNYNGEPHWPVKRQNRVDFQTRMSQFFDYYLLDAPQPTWMQRGVPAIEKGILQGLETKVK